MAYAALGDIKARAGRLGAAWSATSTPSDAQIGGFADDVAAEVDGVLRARGLTPPPAGSDAAKALRGVNADGALVLALEATYPEGDGPGGASDVIDRVRGRYEAALRAIVKAEHPAVALLESEPGAPSASSLWTDEPGYPDAATARAADDNRALRPAFRRGQSF